MEEKLHLYSIMSFNQPDKVDEICEDIRWQYENNVTTCALFSMTLVPEGNPVVDKVGVFCEKYKLFKDKLDEMGVPNGVLIQASMGHSRKLAFPSPFVKFVGFHDGIERDTCCPYDEGFLEYMENVAAHIASLNPDSIMVDDDTRLLARSGRGCGCAKHMARFNELAGTDFTREELLEKITSGKEERYSEIFFETQREAMILLAKAVRKGVDRVNSSIPCTLSVVGGHEAGVEMAKILAGEGNPSVLRIGSGNYTPLGARNQSWVSLRTALQTSYYRDKIDVILAETDTCPHNRYSTGAHSLHTHFVCSILEGAAGAKHWITRLPAYEPESGKAYRKILSKNYGFYSELAKIVPKLSWIGFKLPLPSGNKIDVSSTDYSFLPNEGWCTCVLERLGLPMYFSAENGGISCLNGIGDSVFSDEEILQMLSGNVFLASDTAVNLINRGFGEYIGVGVRDWTGAKSPTTEVLEINKNKCSVQMQRKEIIPLSEDVKIDSKVYNSLDGEHYEYLFPGTTVYKNKIGGTIVTFCGTPVAEFNYMQAFSFLNYSRKQQFIRLAKEMGELPVYYPGDQEVFFRAAEMEDGSLFCAVINISLDPMENIELCCERTINRIEKLMPDGSRSEVTFEIADGKYILDSNCNILEPVILFVY